MGPRLRTQLTPSAGGGRVAMTKRAGRNLTVGLEATMLPDGASGTALPRTLLRGEARVSAFTWYFPWLIVLLLVGVGGLLFGLSKKPGFLLLPLIPLLVTATLYGAAFKARRELLEVFEGATDASLEVDAS